MSSSSSKIVICGAGIAGIAAAHALTVRHGCDNVVLVEAGNPLSLTSDKSTEAYRNWWPGPDWTMTAFMNRSIDLIEELARQTGNRFNLNRRGYAFTTADASKIPFLEKMAQTAETRGAGPARLHATASSGYVPSPESGFDFPLTGADVISDPQLIRTHFPYLSPQTVAVAHARRAGWLSAQQLGMTMLEQAREAGAKLLRGEVVGVDSTGGRVRAVEVMQGDERQTPECTHFVLAAGPLQKEFAQRIFGVDLPIIAERHLKMSFADTQHAIPRTAPMLIWLDEQHLPWSDDERAALEADAESQWLLKKFPAGVHGRPDGGRDSDTVVMLFNHHGSAADVTFPLPQPEHYAEVALRGFSTMVPALAAYHGKGTRPYIDGGYYIKTRENRPLIGPLPVDGAFIFGALSGFGVMGSCAGAELIAKYILGDPLPDYAPAFLLTRYQDPEYRALLDRWGDGGQL